MNKRNNFKNNVLISVVVRQYFFELLTVFCFLFFYLKFLTSILTLLFYLFRLELDEFNSTIATLVEVMDGQATKIERAKLKAIGQRNKVDSEEGRRKTKATELKAQINEDLTDLERLRAEHDSLNAVELEQRSLIERLSNNA